jgi:hypothetical protein
MNNVPLSSPTTLCHFAVPPPAGSDQATELIFKDCHPKSRYFQALNLHLHAEKSPSKVSLHTQLSGRLFLRRPISMAKKCFKPKKGAYS